MDERADLPAHRAIADVLCAVVTGSRSLVSSVTTAPSDATAGFDPIHGVLAVPGTVRAHLQNLRTTDPFRESRAGTGLAALETAVRLHTAAMRPTDPAATDDWTASVRDQVTTTTLRALGTALGVVASEMTLHTVIGAAASPARAAQLRAALRDPGRRTDLRVEVRAETARALVRASAGAAGADFDDELHAWLRQGDPAEALAAALVRCVDRRLDGHPAGGALASSLRSLALIPLAEAFARQERDLAAVPDTQIQRDHHARAGEAARGRIARVFGLVQGTLDAVTGPERPIPTPARLHAVGGREHAAEILR